MGDQGRLRFMRTAGGLTHRNALRKKISKVTVQRLVFLDDHKVLTDIPPSSKDWGKGGTKYVEKQGGAHWLLGKESYPVSVTKGTRLSIEVDLAVESADADPIECEVTAVASLPEGDSGAPNAFTFKSTVVLGGAQTVRLVLTAEEPIGNHVFLVVDWMLTWTVDAAGLRLPMGTTGPHRLYVTYDTPDPGGRPLVHPFGSDPPPIEDGITDKRMHAAVDVIERQWRKESGESWAKGMDRNDPHLIVWSLLRYVPGYTLGEPPPEAVTAEDAVLLKKQYDHPRYASAHAGAWPIYEFPAALAHCQAIVRFILGVLKQAGVPGTAAYVVVYADPDSASGSVALEDSVVPRDQDPTKYRMIGSKQMLVAGLLRDTPRTHKGSLQAPRLTDQVVKAPWPGEPLPSPIASGTTLNTYEACLKFTHGKTYYYGGGVVGQRFPEAQKVLWVFKQLVWVIPADEQEQPDWNVTEIAYPVPPIGSDGKPQYFEPDGDMSRWPT